MKAQRNRPSRYLEYLYAHRQGDWPFKYRPSGHKIKVLQVPALWAFKWDPSLRVQEGPTCEYRPG